MLNNEAIMEALGKVEDPELKRPLTELGMIRKIDIKGSHVTVGVTLTVPGCPMKSKISEDVSAAVGQLEGAESVAVEFDVMSDEQRAELRSKLGHASTEKKELTFAKRFICVASGKGGVGKSTVTANLAAALAGLGHKVGVLDADVYGFSMPRMLGVSGQPTIIDDKIVPLRRGDNLQVVSIGFFVQEDQPVVWRGPLLHKTINQFLTDVMWDQLDFLLLDLPPGTGDVSITVAQAVPNAEVLVVTTPQITATNVAGRIAKLAETTNLKVLGVVENMAYYESNGKRDYIFGRDGGKKLAASLAVPLIGEIPLTAVVREGSDTGEPVANGSDPTLVKLFANMARAIAQT